MIIGLFLGVFIHLYYNRASKLSILDKDEIIFTLIPDTIEIDGSLAKAEAIETVTKEKIIVNYKLQSAEEKNSLLRLKQTPRITAKGSTQEVESVRNLNGFDYQRYLELNQISQKVKIDEISKIEISKISFLNPLKKIKELRRKGIVYTDIRFPKLVANYMNALLFGSKNNSPESFQSTWQKLGVAHLFSLSGMHIYFFIMIFEWLFLSIGFTKEKLYYLSIVFVLFLMVITGLGSGMVRAGIQWLMKKANEKHSWHLSQLDCWSITLFINCLFDPYLLLTAGGQLTYYLTFLIIMINPLINQLENQWYKPWLFSITISWLSLPLIWFHFYEWNWLNFILTIILGPILFVGILPCLAICFILSILFKSLTFNVFEKLLFLFQSYGDYMGQINIFNQVTGKIPTFLIIITILCQLIWLILWEKKGTLWTRDMNYLMLITFLIPLWKYTNPKGMIAFVDVGQGDGIFLQLPFHQGNYLLDTGGRLNYKVDSWEESSDKRGADYTLIPFMKSKGVKTLDTVFISHAHEDHFGDLDRISDHIKIKHLNFGEGSYEQNNFNQMLNYKNLKSTSKHIVMSQSSWRKNGVTVNCLYPLTKGDGQNNDSVVLKVEIKNKKILLMGDLEKEGENELLNESSELLKSDILKAGHHGSKTSTQEQFLDAVQPTEAIISCGKNNHYNHPSKETLDNFTKRGIKEYRTDEQGMIYYEWTPFSKKLSKAKYIKQ